MDSEGVLYIKESNPTDQVNSGNNGFTGITMKHYKNTGSLSSFDSQVSVFFTTCNVSHNKVSGQVRTAWDINLTYLTI